MHITSFSISFIRSFTSLSVEVFVNTTLFYEARNNPLVLYWGHTLNQVRIKKQYLVNKKINMFFSLLNSMDLTFVD